MLFRKDPCGIVCIVLTYAMLLHCLYVFLFVIIIPLLNDRLDFYFIYNKFIFRISFSVFSLYGTLNALIISTFIFLSIFSHARAAYFDPGFVPLPKKGIDFSDVKTNENNKVKYSKKIEFLFFEKILYCLLAKW
jgi:hypothetical protein